MKECDIIKVKTWSDSSYRMAGPSKPRDLRPWQSAPHYVEFSFM